MRVDSHHHLWKYNDSDFGWMTAEQSVLKRDYLPSDLNPALQEHGIDKTVAVQARSMVGETEFLLEVAETVEYIGGVVGWIDFEANDLSSQLERFADYPACKGFRHVIHDEPDVDFMVRPAFLRGLRQLGKHSFTYDLLIRPEHIPNSIALVGQFPAQPFVVDHIAKPLIADGTLNPWAQELQTLAEFDNVWCKLSGMVTEAKWSAWTEAQFRPYIDVVLESFGPERLMFGSDWPVCLLSASYTAVHDIVANYLSKDEQDAVFGATAEHFYGLETSSPT